MIGPNTSADLSQVHYEPPKTLANKFVDQINHIESAGIRKIVLDANSLPDMLGGMPSDAAMLMNQLMGAQNAQADNNLPKEAEMLMKQMLASQGHPQVPTTEDPNAGTELIRKRPDYLERALKEAAKPKDRFELDVDNACVLGIFVKVSTRQNVLNTLRTLSKIIYEENSQEPIFYYNDLGISFYFDENDVVSEIEFDSKYRKQTTKGLKIGDSIDKAIEIYGKPRMKSAKGAIWNNFSVIMEDREDAIKIIRAKIRD